MDERGEKGGFGDKGAIARFAASARSEIPLPNTILFGSVVWGLVMSLSVMASIWLQNGLLTNYRLPLASLYFYGGALAFAPGLWLARLALRNRSMPLRIIGGAAAIFVVTHIATAGIFALQYRMFYAHWHANFPEVTWFFQQAFTSAGAVFQYSVTSIYFYWPFVLIADLGFGLWFGRSNRPMAH